MKNKLSYLWLRALFLLLTPSIVFTGHSVFAQEPNLAPLNPEFIQYQQNFQRGIITPQVTEEGYGLGFIPPPIDLSHLKGQKIGRKIFLESLPTSYDLRTTGKLTSVKNQGSYGTCWAHATYGSLESCLLPGETRDFSENNLVNLHGFDYSLGGFHDVNKGGNYFMSTAYLSRWAGPVNESDDPYPKPGASPSGLTVQKHVQEALSLPGRSSSLDNDTIKQAVIDYGAIYTSIYWSGASYNSTNAAYYYNGTGSTNHAVCIVGWNDAYPSSNFSATPPGNGAFIVKNSWGTGWGNSGYFYISYYDTQVGKGNAVFNNTEATSNYKNIYQYDWLGLVNGFGYSSNTGWFSNIFTAGGNQFLGAISFYALALGSVYEIYIHTDVAAGQPGSGFIAGAKTGTIAISGYHTIVLNSPVLLTSGHQFSVVVKLVTPGYNYPIPIECPKDGYSGGATANAGESFTSSNGSAWSDITGFIANANVCLKAFANEGYTISASVSGGHGSVSPVSQIVARSSTVTINITPDAGYHIAGITDNGVPVTVTNPYVIRGVTKGHDVVVTFNDIKGDINNDGVVNITDVILCLRQAIGLDPVNPTLADMNGDGLVNITDVILILRKAIGLDAKTRAEISKRLSGG